MLILYYFQGDFCESLETPNAFSLADNGEVTLAQFKQGFPVANKNDYFFRFRMEDPMQGFVWADITNPSEVLPVYDGVITAKILKLSTVQAAKRKMVLRRKDINVNKDIIGQLQSQLNANKRNNTRPYTSPENVGNASYEASAPTRPPKPVKQTPPAPAPAPAPAPSSTNNPLAQPPKVTPPPAAAPAADLLDTDGPAYNPATQQSPPPDILSFDDDRTTSPYSSSQKVAAKKTTTPLSADAIDIDDDYATSTKSGGELNRTELAAKREEHISMKVQAAVDFKKEMDMKKEQEQLDFDAAKEKHEKALLSRATNNKEKRNVRTLLSTMHTVLPSGTKWKAIGLGDVLEPGQVKKQYRKAMLVVHPDHCLNADPETKFVCKRIFEAINEAYDEFSKKENV